MVAAVIELGMEANHRIAGQDALADVLAQALFHRGDEVARHHAADHGILELKVNPRIADGENSIHTSPNWPWPPDCFLWRPWTLTDFLMVSR